MKIASERAAVAQEASLRRKGAQSARTTAEGASASYAAERHSFLRRSEHLRAQPRKEIMQAMRRVEHLRAQPPQKRVQAMRWGEHLRAQCRRTCEHNRNKNGCKLFCGGSICEHNRRRSGCKDRGGASICEHNRPRSMCKPCSGSSIREHNRP